MNKAITLREKIAQLHYVRGTGIYDYEEAPDYVKDGCLEFANEVIALIKPYIYDTLLGLCRKCARR